MKIDPTMWLDTVRSVPAIGVSWLPTYETSSELLERARPFLYRWRETGKLRGVAVEDDKVAIQHSSGLYLTIGPDRLVGQFLYENSIEGHGEVTAPTIRESRPLTPYVELMAEVQSMLLEVLAELMSSHGNVRRETFRIGIVADGTVKADMLPPGLEQFLNHLGEPWGDEPVEVKGDITATLARTDEGRDVCHHVIHRSLASDALVQFKLDWQRYFDKPKQLTAKVMSSRVEDCVESAFEYFGRFGMGELKYDR